MLRLWFELVTPCDVSHSAQRFLCYSTTTIACWDLYSSGITYVTSYVATTVAKTLDQCLRGSEDTNHA
eukprot:2357314-Amphidinium_carterae.1